MSVSNYFKELRAEVLAAFSPWLNQSVTLRARVCFISYSILKNAPPKLDVFDVWKNAGTVFYWVYDPKILSSDGCFNRESPCLLHEEKRLLEVIQMHADRAFERSSSFKITIELVDNSNDRVLSEIVRQKDLGEV